MDEVVDCYELAPLQQGMLLHALSTSGSGVDVEQIIVTTQDRLDVPTFEQAFQPVMQRHPVLRTRLRWSDVDEPCQEVVADGELPATVADWSGLKPEVAEQRFDAQLRADRRQDFDLSRAPILRLFISHLPGGGSRVLWTFHHVLGDGRSCLVLLEWFALYDAALRGETVTLPPARPYRDYVEWRRTLDLTPAEAFWRNELGTFTAPTRIGADAPKSSSGEDPYGAVQRCLSRTLSDRLRGAARDAGVTVNTMFQAAWAVLLSHYSGESDVVFGATRTGRWTGSSDAEVRIGLFINTLPMRVDVDADARIGPWLRSLRAKQIELRPFEHTPLAAVHGWSGVDRRTPLFESIVVYDHRTLDAFLQIPGRHFDYVGQTNFPIALRAYGDDDMVVRLEYSTERFSDAAIARMLTHLVNLLTQLADGDAAHVGDLDPVGVDERAALVGAGPRPLFDTPDVTLHAGFARQAAATPEAIAVSVETSTGREELTYADLDHRAEAVAAHLRSLGVTANQPVGLRVERGADVVVGMLAILKAGGAYLPMDPVYPGERVAFMLEDADAKVVLTQRALAGELAALPVHCICLDAPLPPSPSTPSEPSHVTGDDLAYVMYTSGSTGKPKGVTITHHNVLRLFAATDEWFDVGPDDVWTLFHSYSFDISVWEIWGALLSGGRLVVVTRDVSRDPQAFHTLLHRERVTMLCQTPTAFRSLIDVDQRAPATAFALRDIVFVGEALEPHILKPWIDRYGDTTPRLVNMYGPTETTVYAAYRPITRADLNEGSVIGVPIPDLSLYVLDAHRRPVPIGVPGELYIAGPGVATGYLNRPDLTAERFLPDPFHDGMAYRSGDLARRHENGDLEYLGRIDQQVKIRGHRIEPGEIEAAIVEHPAVRQVAVIAREDVPGEKNLVAYLVADVPPSNLIADLRQTLHKRLPDYMVPAHFHHLHELPRTPNGKLDRTALPAPQHRRTESGNPYTAARNPAEKTIADVWKTVLRIDEVGLDDHFFELGGDSLLSIRVHAQLTNRLHADLPIVALLQYPTVRTLARHLTENGGTTSPPATMDRARKQREAYARHRNLIGRR